MPLYYLIALFIGLPMAELAVLLKVDEIFHFWPTFLLVISTGVIGSVLVKWQGIVVLRTIQNELAVGNIPAPQMMDGVMILLAGALLITPGLITDTVGFLLLVPFVRERIRNRIRRALERKMRNGEVQVNIRRF